MGKKKTPILSNLFFLLKFIWKINKRIYALNIFKVVLDIAQSLTTVIFLRYIVQYIIIDKNWTLTAIFVGALVVSLGITQILSSVIKPILRKDMDLLEKQILTQVGMTAIKMDYFEMEKPFAKDLLQLAQDPGKFVGVLENVIVSISTFVTIIGLAATILAVDKILIVPLLVAIVLILLSEKVKALNWTKWKNLVIPPLRRTNYVLGLLKNPIYGKEVRINAIQENLNWNMAYYNHILKTQPIDYSDEFYGRFRVTKEQIIDAAKYIFRRCNMTVAVKGDRKKINAEAIEKILESLD